MKKMAIGLLSSFVFLQGCGGSSGGTSTDSSAGISSTTQETILSGNAPAESNITYLEKNHANYSTLNEVSSPAPVKDVDALSIQWYITANTPEDAIKLHDHISFMNQRLLDGGTPRGWDELFLSEAYMKINHRYSTFVSIENDTTVLVTKTATDRCAYEVIAAHSDVVSHDFFGQGIIDIDYSETAKAIINNDHCVLSKSDMESYIATHKKQKGGQGQGGNGHGMGQGQMQ